jgi:hypothetical protein
MSKVVAPLFSLSASKAIKKKLVFQQRKGTSVVYWDRSHKGLVTDGMYTRRQNFIAGKNIWNGYPAANKDAFNLLAKYLNMTGYNLFIKQYLELPEAPSGPHSATGGIIYTDGDYNVHKFITDGTFTPDWTGTVEVLLVGGGGGGGVDAGGGGGAGGVLYSASVAVTKDVGVNVVVGDGGAGHVQEVPGRGGSGEDSSFGVVVADGGGAGGGNTEEKGADGGSGGGAGDLRDVGGKGTVGQGYDGGDSKPEAGTNQAPGGGGGASEKGDNGVTTNIGGDGGDGTDDYSDLLIVAEAGVDIGGVHWIAGGAGGAGIAFNAAGGKGGGGQGGKYPNPAGDGVENTGGGGGGTWWIPRGGNGGSGIVIVRYSTLPG